MIIINQFCTSKKHHVPSRIGLWSVVLGQAELKGKLNVKVFSFVEYITYIESISLPPSQSLLAW